MAEQFSLGFSDNSSLNRLDEILARTQQAGATAIGQLQEQALATQRLGANGTSQIQLSGMQIGEGLTRGLGSSGSAAVGGTLEEILAGVHDERVNNERTLLGNGTPLIQALFGGALNLVGEGIALIPGLEDASGIGTTLLGRKKDANKLLDRELDIKGLIEERNQRKFENKLAEAREERIEKSERFKADNEMSAELRLAERTKKAAERKEKHDFKLAKFLSDERFRSQESSQASTSGDLGVRLGSNERIANAGQRQIEEKNKAAAADKKKTKDEESVDTRISIVQPSIQETIDILRENSDRVPGMEVMIGGPDGKDGILNMQVRGEFPIATLPNGSPALSVEGNERLKGYLVSQGVKAFSNESIQPEAFVNTYKGALAFATTTFQKSLEDRSDPNTPAGKAAGGEMHDLAIVQTVANSMSGKVAVEIQGIIEIRENLIVAGTILNSIFPGEGRSLLDIANGDYTSIGEFEKKSESPLSKVLQDGRLSQILEAYSAYESGDSRSIDFLIQAGILKSFGTGNPNSRSGGSRSIVKTQLGGKISTLVEALGGNR